jgi:hypothetical protein
MAVMPRLGRLRQEDNEFKATMNYITSFRSAWAI